MEFGYLLVGAAIGAAIGAWGYRYMLKRDPFKLEMLAAQAKAMSAKAKARFD